MPFFPDNASAERNDTSVDGKNVIDESRLVKWRCPGVFRNIEFLACPDCGGEVEFFPQDLVMSCPDCHTEVARVSSACISHCPAQESYCYRQMVRHQALLKLDLTEDCRSPE